MIDRNSAFASSVSCEVIIETVLIDAAEDWQLTATLFSNPEKALDAPIILMSSAAGVPQGYYKNFATYLVRNGAKAVLTYDYRGMSKSAGEKRRWTELRMFHWGQYDFPAAANYLKSKYPNHTLVGMGHSYGGQALGLSGAAHQFDRYATVATMSGYWGNLDTPYSVWFQSQIIGRFLALTLGYIPKNTGLGEAFPGSVFLDWANWIKHPNYWFDQKDVPGLDNFSKVTLPYLSIHIDDDPWGTPKAIEAFMRYYNNADLKNITISPGESGKIGHLGFFRQRHENHHWPLVADYLIRNVMPVEK